MSLLLVASAPALHASFIINYSDPANAGFNDPTTGASRRAAFEWAVGQWDTWTRGADPVPIRVDTYWDSLGAGILGGSYSAYRVWKGAGLGVADTRYGDVLADFLAGTDLYEMVYGTTHWDFQLVFNTDFTAWNYDYTLGDGSFGGLYDFASVSMHEVGHGMGLFDSFSSNGNWGYLDPSDGSYDPLIYDRFLEYADGTDLIASRPTSVTSPTYWSGTHATAANGGQRVRMYAPSPFQDGSSLAHMNDNTFPGYLMTHAIGTNDARRNIDPIMEGMLFDMGWYVPEPGTASLMGMGMMVLVAMRRRKREG